MQSLKINTEVDKLLNSLQLVLKYIQEANPKPEYLS